MLINILLFLLSKPGTNPTWKWLRCKTGDVCHKFCFYCRSAGIVFFCRLKWQRLESSLLISFPIFVFCCFRISARTSRTMWSRSTPSWRRSSRWSSCPTPSTSLLTSGSSHSNTTECEVAWKCKTQCNDSFISEVKRHKAFLLFLIYKKHYFDTLWP